jgi:type IV secretion system protein VirD4
VLASYMHAAGLAGGDMRHVYQWITREDQAPLRILANHPDAAETARDQAGMYLAMNHRTRTGIASTLNQVLRFMQHPGCVAAVTVPGGGPGFDFEAFVTSRDTLYLVASDSATSPVRPLFLTICAELAYTARQVGSVSRLARPPRQRLLGSAWFARVYNALFPPRRVARLDPPLSMELDEVANTAPVPAAAWATWAAGSGVRLHLYAQAYAQLEERWGKAGAAVIWQCCKTKVIYGATSEDELSAMVERLCGPARLRVRERTYDGKRHYRHENVPVLPAATLRQLPENRAVVVQGRARPAIVRVELVRNRGDYKQWRRDGAPLALPAPPERQVPAPMPALLTSPKETRWPGDELAARRGRNETGRRPATEPGEGTETPAAVGDSPTGSATPAPPPAGTRRPRPPSRPAPWRRPAGGDDEQ